MFVVTEFLHGFYETIGGTTRRVKMSFFLINLYSDARGVMC